MKQTVVYRLTKAARRSGGDRYEKTSKKAPCDTLYLNQEYSRVDGQVKEHIEVSFDHILSKKLPRR